MSVSHCNCNILMCLIMRAPKLSLKTSWDGILDLTQNLDIKRRKVEKLINLLRHFNFPIWKFNTSLKCKRKINNSPV